MAKRDQVRIGIIGAGFLAETRARCYARVGGAKAAVVAVAARTDKRVHDYAHRYHIPQVFSDYHQLLDSPEIDLVDLCVPNHLHRAMTEAAAQAGKHIVCTKPLTAYVGQDLAEAEQEAVAAVNRERMLEVAQRDAQAMLDAAAKHGVQLMYGENWVYAPSIRRATELMLASGGSILEMRGGECHSGSHSEFSKLWRHTGGGALIRLGAHPIGAMLYLKQQEGLHRSGTPIRPVAVTAEVGDLSRIAEHEKNLIATGWQDVENWAALIIRFEDGSSAVVYASDGVLGGMESRLDIFLSNAHLKCNLSPNNLLQAYAPNAQVFGDEYIIEKIDSSAGWTTPMPNEDWTSGHLAMCEDFVDAVVHDRPALSTGSLGLEVLRVVYSGYLAASRGCRVELS